MMASGYLLDTNILLFLIRGSAVGRHIESTYRLSAAQFRPIISIVSHAEVWTLADRNNWGIAKRQALETMLANLTTVMIDDQAVVDAYVSIEAACRQHPPGNRGMGQNDKWIGATAIVTGATILTTDTDFDHLHPDHLRREYIDPAIGS